MIVISRGKKKFIKIICSLFLFVIALILIINNYFSEQENERPKSILNPYGVSVHFTGNPVDLKLIKDAGLKTVRMDMQWSTIEKQRGVYDFSNTGYDELVNGLEENGLRPMFILAYSNSLYENQKSITTKEGLEHFGKFVSAVTNRYKEKDIIWEIWNEPNIEGFWKPKPNYEEYSKLVENTSKIIKKNDPTSILVAPALAGLNGESLMWFEELLKRDLLKYIDAITVHPYRASMPETVTSDYKQLKMLISKYSDKKIQIISGEWGYSTGKGWSGLNLNEYEQADYAVRMFLINQYNNIPLSIWYDWKNDGLDPNNGEHNFGLRKENVYKPKQSYFAIKNLENILSGYKFSERISLNNNNDYLLMFENKKGEKKYVVWTTDSLHSIKLPDGVDGSIITIYGEKIGNVHSSKKVEIGNSPIYILGSEDN
ncbi:cellulase family glycosylhydrolase [Niallia sp. 03133]|uniref:cellulase family glycosylhydrolase n=1 Tax=Niallia sp. 03133 TaxID=3458060 RepID=UPI00404430A0